MSTTLKVIKPTFLKRSPFFQASELADNEKFFLDQGEFKVHSYTEEGGHFRVAFLVDKFQGLNTWYVFPGHIQILCEGRVIYPEQRILLNVGYQSQLDNSIDPYGTCNTSACFMAANFLKPGVCNGSDDYFLRHYVAGKGRDSTRHDHMTVALDDIGVRSTFYTKLNFVDLDAQLDQGMPVVLGVLHHGTDAWPTGFGHMILCIGREDDPQSPNPMYICHDPYGKGWDYLDPNGAFVKYSHRTLTARWQVGTKDNGYGRIFYR